MSRGLPGTPRDNCPGAAPGRPGTPLGHVPGPPRDAAFSDSGAFAGLIFFFFPRLLRSFGGPHARHKQQEAAIGTVHGLFFLRFAFSVVVRTSQDLCKT